MKTCLKFVGVLAVVALFIGTLIHYQSWHGIGGTPQQTAERHASVPTSVKPSTPMKDGSVTLTIHEAHFVFTKPSKLNVP